MYTECSKSPDITGSSLHFGLDREGGRTFKLSKTPREVECVDL